MERNSQTTIAWHLDSTNNKLNKYYLTSPNQYALEYKYDARSAYIREIYNFDKTGKIDSIIRIEYNGDKFEISSTGETFGKIERIDTNITNFNYEILNPNPYNCIIYDVKNGKKSISRIDIFGYDSLNNLIVYFQNEGRVQFDYKYDKKNNLIEERIFTKLSALFTYDKNGLRKERLTSKGLITKLYSYNNAGYLIKETPKWTKNKIAFATTYEYFFN
jgi:hypothetical protein